MSGSGSAANAAANAQTFNKGGYGGGGSGSAANAGMNKYFISLNKHN